MHYFKFNIKDYFFATKHLNYTEHGAYLHLISAYYETEKPLSLNVDHIIKGCMAKNEEEINAIKYVLENFFTKTEDGYVQKRSQVEIDAFQAESGRKSKTSKEMWRKKNASKVEVDSTNDANQETIKNKHETQYTSEKFLEFWDVWPKSKRKQSKPACFRKWKANHLDQIADKIINHVNLCKESSQWREGYEPAPLTYLTQGRYEDEVDDAYDWTIKRTA